MPNPSLKQSLADALTDDNALIVRPLTRVTTQSGFAFDVRPVEPSDDAALADLLDNVTQDDMRFRYLASVAVSQQILDQLINVDHVAKDNFLAFDPDTGTMIASAEIAKCEQSETAEIAMVIHKAYKGRGIGWSLLEHVARHAKERGFRKLKSIESRDNHDAIALEREMGFKARACPGDPTLVLLELNLVKGL